ncbi:hypothetical protein Hypma_010762 [Hypsizygus marmoreus]|uniref:Uncharacterized protein n=1 Tax=Hypsizygus marmoreus TaxID=39966 RepID=A0A369JPB4_HYPMA|nr:hypothetical protein Hypma_010762 [Hypsizygus marmoreus]
MFAACRLTNFLAPTSKIDPPPLFRTNHASPRQIPYAPLNSRVSVKHGACIQCVASSYDATSISFPGLLASNKPANSGPSYPAQHRYRNDADHSVVAFPATSSTWLDGPKIADSSFLNQFASGLSSPACSGVGPNANPTKNVLLTAVFETVSRF